MPKKTLRLGQQVCFFDRSLDYWEKPRVGIVTDECDMPGMVHLTVNFRPMLDNASPGHVSKFVHEVRVFDTFADADPEANPFCTLETPPDINIGSNRDDPVPLAEPRVIEKPKKAAAPEPRKPAPPPRASQAPLQKPGKRPQPVQASADED